MRFSRASKVFSVNQSVDHRPRALLVSGFEPDELDALLAHFAQFGEITGKEVNLSVPELVVQYRARQHAEHALHAARNYSDRTLSITWVTNSKPIAAPALNGDSSHEIKDVTGVWVRVERDQRCGDQLVWTRTKRTKSIARGDADADTEHGTHPQRAGRGEPPARPQPPSRTHRP
ncbi:RNA-binding protein 27 isoform 3 [Danaus plexippus plexippus]|uniref:RNA-binding protein 27 isoform 3 n=1 Tax=Danaus plexippus plexippus TaxID=278856 RepID=A0A212ER17_DANPL|nr:RNA-binding protein 27 isoform 3 [Danaus plexippus plexippus]